jgi:hypothetical protein
MLYTVSVIHLEKNKIVKLKTKLLREMPIGTYFVQVQVKENFVPLYQYKHTDDAKIQVKSLI